MINLTPHTINVRTETGVASFPPSGTVARVLTIETVIGNYLGIPVISRSFGEVEGIPEDTMETILVSSMVLDALKGRPNTFAPDTGKTAIRDEKGFIAAVTRLVAA